MTAEDFEIRRGLFRSGVVHRNLHTLQETEIYMEMEWCQPKSEPNQIWVLMFDDLEKAVAVYHNEDQAQEAFEKANLNWSCYLLTSTPLTERRWGMTESRQELLTTKVTGEVTLIRRKHRIGVAIGSTTVEGVIGLLSMIPSDAVVDEVLVHEDIVTIEFHEERRIRE